MSYRLPDAQDKAGYVRHGFDAIARHYDRFNDLITQGQHRRWKAAMVRRLGLRPGDRVLDLCCGTGDIARRCLGPVGSGGGAVAADFSLPMLRIARRRLRGDRRGRGSGAEPAPHVIVAQADALALPFADGAFRAVTIGYGLRNVTDRARCLSEVRRVLAPGGVLASLDVGKVRVSWLQPLVRFYLFRVVPWIGRLLQPEQDMYTYLPHSSDAFPHQDELLAEMHAAGFAEGELIEFLWGASVIHLARKPGS